ncbi:MAG TPA: TetR family transcriptional regulator [Streptosporangiaceae bacterium]|nr:TetR family transcriptional regulator [Streptosporangiaceae bacterium]
MPGELAADRCEPAGLRERKKLATRRAIGIAAMRLAVERGLDNVLVEEIAAAAGVSARTFSNYFSSKYEAICTLAMDRGRQAGAALRERPADEPLGEAITRAVLQQYAAAEQAPGKDWIDGVRLVISSPALQGEYLKTQYVTQHALAAAIADRTGADPRTDMFSQVIAGAVTAATQVAMERWLLADPPVALAPLIRLALGQLALGQIAERALAPGGTALGRPAPSRSEVSAARLTTFP